jgi:hypothetical protein
MPIISYIPDEYEKGFLEIAKLKEDDFKKIEAALSKTNLTSSIRNLTLKVGNSSQAHHLPLEEIFSAVGALIEFLDSREDIEKLAAEVSVLISNNQLSQEESQNLENRLVVLLNDQKIYYAYKSRKLITENANNFISCRVVSDIRPVFDFDIEQDPIAGVITHNLHIHYDSELSGIHKDFFICLDAYDIQVLIEALSRAEKKEEVLGRILKKSGITDLND